MEPETESKNLDLRLIPRLVDTDGQTAVPRGTRDENLDPGSWSCEDVAQFLEINEIKCDPLVEAIIEQVSILYVGILKACIWNQSLNRIKSVKQGNFTNLHFLP